MDQLHRSADKLAKDAAHLVNLVGTEPTDAQIEVALSIAKRVRRESTFLVRRLAAQRDQLQP